MQFQFEFPKSSRNQSRRAAKVKFDREGDFNSVSSPPSPSFFSILLRLIVFPLEQAWACYRLLILLVVVFSFVLAVFWWIGDMVSSYFPRPSKLSTGTEDDVPAGDEAEVDIGAPVRPSHPVCLPAYGVDMITDEGQWQAALDGAYKSWNSLTSLDGKPVLNECERDLDRMLNADDDGYESELEKLLMSHLDTRPSSAYTASSSSVDDSIVPSLIITPPALDVPSITISPPENDTEEANSYRQPCPNMGGSLSVPIIPARRHQQEQVDEDEWDRIWGEEQEAPTVEKKKVKKTFAVWQGSWGDDKKEKKEKKNRKGKKAEKEPDLEARLREIRQILAEEKERKRLEQERARALWEQAEEARRLWLTEQHERMAFMPYQQRMVRSAGMQAGWGDSRGSFGYSYVQQRYDSRAFGGRR
ncbi:hypothetical protein IAT40_006956 [Kwoniella sp. CBS 6097]